jgi:hypothetical protein
MANGTIYKTRAPKAISMPRETTCLFLIYEGWGEGKRRPICSSMLPKWAGRCSRKQCQVDVPMSTVEDDFTVVNVRTNFVAPAGRLKMTLSAHSHVAA